jgi:hypothetical protein
MLIQNVKQAIRLLEDNDSLNEVHINGFQIDVQRFIQKYGLMGQKYEIVVLLSKPDYRNHEQYVRGYIIKRLKK